MKLNQYLQPIDSIPATSREFMTALDFDSRFEKGAITNYILQDQNVTAEKLSADAISVSDESVTTSKLAPESVTTSKIAGSAVTTSKIAGLAVTNEKINDFDFSKGSGTIIGAIISNSSIAGAAVTGDLTFAGSQKIIGGTSTTADLTFQTTTGAGTTGADMHFLVGNNGTTEAMTILNSGAIQLNTTRSSGKLTVASTDVNVVHFYGNQSSGSGAGAGFIAYSDDGAAMASGDRLGFFIFGGGKNSSNGFANAVAYTAYASEAWNDSKNGAEVRIETTPLGATSRSQGITFTSEGGLIVNEQGRDADIRFEGDTDVNNFFSDASTDRIGVGLSTPGYKLDVNGDINIVSTSAYRVGGTAGVSGSFTTTDGKTVTVTKGIITNIV